MQEIYESVSIDFLSSFPNFRQFHLTEVVRRTDRLIEEYVGFLHVFRITFPVNVIVDDIVIHMVHRTVFLPGGAYD